MIVKKANKPNSSKIEEDSYDKFMRSREEKREREGERKHREEIEAKKEKKRIEEIVLTYLDNLKQQIDKKDSWSFWTFPDRSGFKKLKYMDFKTMQNIIINDINNYKNRRVVSFKLITYHKDTEPTSLRVKYGTLFAVGLRVMNITEDGISKKPKDCWGCDFTWDVDDFKTTKFSFKLLERIMGPIAAKEKTCTSLTGYPITRLIHDLKKLKYDLSDVLNPLAGL